MARTPVGATDASLRASPIPGYSRSDRDRGRRDAAERGGSAVADQLADERFEQFCSDADVKTPARAAAELRRYGLSDAIVDELVDRYERHVGVVREVVAPHYMQSGGRITWYAGPRPKDPCWPKLVELLAGAGFDDATLAALDDSTTRIVSLLEHPATAEFTTKGLVLGHIQAGKTTNYTGVIAKSADRGYRLVIVLAGIHNELRRQTQTRLIRQLIDPNPTLWHQLTDPDRDFRPTANAPSYFAENVGQKVLCVVKKNAAVLRKLIAWLEEASDQLALIPALVIDDEADQAAVATRTINPLIRRLLDTLPRVGYVGYTATPFANLFIDPSTDDLYPRHFIVDLPQPKDHFGTETIFGRDPLDGEDPGDYDDDSLDMVRIVPDDEVPLVRPASDRDVAGFDPVVTGELRRAILYFWLATAARRARGTGVPHSTMLIHTSVRVAVHEAFRSPIETLRSETLHAIDSQDGPLLRELELLWETETARVPAEALDEVATPFDELVPRLRESITVSRVILDNSSSDERLDYASEPVVAIAVGGNTLSRGLTLEGLVVSFFVRAASAYDTLLQMGRWFGYREGYADLPRIWMTRELHGWFRHLAGIEAEIRQDIERYMQDDVTPETFAVRIRTHPSLTITAAAKMRDAVMATASFGGMRIQTRYFRAGDAKWLEANLDAARALIGTIGGAKTTATSPTFVGQLWRGVATEDVIAFLEQYTVHEKAPNNRTDLIADYVRKRNERGRLLTWNVAVVGSATAGRGEFDFGSGVVVPKIIRARLEQSPSEAADIRTLMSRRDAAVDLALEPGVSLTEALIAEKRREQMPDTALLALYPIDRVSPTNRSRREPLAAVRDVLGIGIVFPRPVPGEDDNVYMQADLSGVAESRDEYLEVDDLRILEDEQL
jgi:hypothetical protein